MEGARAFHEDLAALEGGDVLVLVGGVPFRCPPAPYEAAMVARGVLDRRGVRARVTLATPEPQPMPIAGPEMGARVRALVESRGVALRFGAAVAGFGEREARFKDGSSLPFDALAVVPPHRAPAVLREAGLVGESGFVPVDGAACATRHEGVWAVGDCASVPLPVGKPLPKAGVLAEAAALVVAENIARPGSARLDARGSCFIETGDGLAVEAHGHFSALPAPAFTAGEPSAGALAAKRAFERERLARWFGHE